MAYRFSLRVTLYHMYIRFDFSRPKDVLLRLSHDASKFNRISYVGNEQGSLVDGLRGCMVLRFQQEVNDMTRR